MTYLQKISLLTLVVLISLTSCESRTKQVDSGSEDIEDVNSPVVEDSKEIKEESTEVTSDFDLESIPETDKLTGAFPYFILPEGYVFNHPKKKGGEGEIKDFEQEFFIVNENYLAREGKSFKAQIVADKNSGKEFGKLEIQENFDAFIKELGGVKVHNGNDLDAETKKNFREEHPNASRDGYLHSSSNYKDIHTYVIRKPDAWVWVQYNLGRYNANISILEEKVFEDSMSLMDSDEILSRLTTDGKAVLHINFDTNKATLKADGKEAIQEIFKALQTDNSLRISIEGHTDNTGSSAHNQKLSEERAEAVVQELKSLGIAMDRLSSKGFGSEQPIADNSTEEGKAQNRRVELIKI